MSRNMRRVLLVALAFVIVMALSWLITDFKSRSPSPQQACTQKCAAIQRDGYLVYRGPDTPKDKTAYSVCECR